MRVDYTRRHIILVCTFHKLGKSKVNIIVKDWKENVYICVYCILEMLSLETQLKSRIEKYKIKHFDEKEENVKNIQINWQHSKQNIKRDCYGQS